MPPKQRPDDTTAGVIANLSKREKQVIRLRFGIGIRVHSRKELSQRFSIALERVRRIEVVAIRKLRYPGLLWLWMLRGAHQ